MFKMGCSMARKILAIDGKNSPGANDPTLGPSSSSSSSAAAAAAKASKGENAADSNNRGNSKTTKSNAEEIDDFSKLQDDPRNPLNVRQIFKITKSWKAIARTMSKTGTAMFLNLFEQNQDLFHLFERFQHLKSKDLHDSMELREHAATVMSTLDRSISALSDYDNFVNYLHSIGKLHRKVPGFKREYFWKIEQPFLKAVKQTLDERCNETIEEIYKIAIKLIIETIAEGYGQDGSALASSEPESGGPASGAAGDDTSAERNDNGPTGLSKVSSASSGARIAASNGASAGRQTKVNNLGLVCCSPETGREPGDMRDDETMIVSPTRTRNSFRQPTVSSGSVANALGGDNCDNLPLMKCIQPQRAGEDKQCGRRMVEELCISREPRRSTDSEIGGRKMGSSKGMPALFVADKQQQEARGLVSVTQSGPNPSEGFTGTLFALEGLLSLMVAKSGKVVGDCKRPVAGEPAASCPAAAGNEDEAIKRRGWGVGSRLFGQRRRAGLQSRLASAFKPANCGTKNSLLCGNSNQNKLNNNHLSIGGHNNKQNSNGNSSSRAEAKRLDENGIRSRGINEGEFESAERNANFSADLAGWRNAKQADCCARRKSASENGADSRDKRGGGACGKASRPIEGPNSGESEVVEEEEEEKEKLSASFEPATRTRSSGRLSDERAQSIVSGDFSHGNNSSYSNNNNNSNNIVVVVREFNDAKVVDANAATCTVRDHYARAQKGDSDCDTISDSDCTITSEAPPNGSLPAEEQANCGTIGSPDRIGLDCIGGSFIGGESASFQCRHLTCPPRSSNDDDDDDDDDSGDIEDDMKPAEAATRRRLTTSDSSRAAIVHSDCAATLTMESSGEETRNDSAKPDRGVQSGAPRSQSSRVGGPRRALRWLKRTVTFAPNSHLRTGRYCVAGQANNNNNNTKDDENSQQLKYTNELSSRQFGCSNSGDASYRCESRKATRKDANQLERNRPEVEPAVLKKASSAMRSQRDAAAGNSIKQTSFESLLSAEPADLAQLIKLLLLTLASRRNISGEKHREDELNCPPRLRPIVEGDIDLS